MANKLTYILEVDDKGTAVVKQFAGAVAKETENAAESTGRWSTSIDKANGAVVSIMGSLKTMAMYVGVAFGVKAIVDFTKESILLAARVETLGVVLGVVGENAGYSRGEMNKFVDQVKGMGITTEAAHDAVIKLAQSQIDLSQSSKLARVSQDAAVIGNINSSEAFQRMINGIRSGEVEILKTIGLSVNFEQAYKQAAITLGKSTDALSQQEKAQARANAVLEAGTKIQGAYEASMSTAGKMMLSLTRYVEEAKLAFGELFGGAFTSAIELATDALKNVNKWIKEMRDNGAIQDVSDLIRGQLKGQLIGIKALFEGIVKVITTGPERLNALLQLINMISRGIGYMSTLIGGAFDLYAKLSDLGEKSIDIVKKAWGVVFTTSEETRKQAQVNLKKSIEDWKKYGSSIGATLDETVAKLLEQEREFNATTKRRTATEIAAEEAASKARAEAAAAANDLTEKGKKTEETFIETLLRKAGVSKKAYSDMKTAGEEAAKAYDRWVKEAEVEGAVFMALQDDTKQTIELMKEGADKAATAYERLVKQAEEDGAVFVEQKKEEEQSIQDRTAAYNQMYADLKGKASAYYDHMKDNLAKQARDYASMTGDEALAAAWLTERLKQLDIEKGKSSDSFFAGVKAGLLEMANHLYTWGQAGYDMFKTFTGSMSSTFSTLFKDTITGHLKSFGDYFKSFWDTMLNKFVDILAQMLAEWLTLQAAMKASQWMGFGSSAPGATNNGQQVAGQVGTQVGMSMASKGLYNWLFGGSTAGGVIQGAGGLGAGGVGAGGMGGGAYTTSGSTTGAAVAAYAGPIAAAVAVQQLIQHGPEWLAAAMGHKGETREQSVIRKMLMNPSEYRTTPLTPEEIGMPVFPLNPYEFAQYQADEIAKSKAGAEYLKSLKESDLYKQMAANPPDGYSSWEEYAGRMREQSDFGYVYAPTASQDIMSQVSPSDVLGRPMSFHSGGEIPIAHRGLSMGPDEGLFLGLSREGILSRRGMDTLGKDNFERVNRGEKPVTPAPSKVEVHFNLNGTVIDRAAVNDFAEKIYPRLKRLEQWGH